MPRPVAPAPEAWLARRAFDCRLSPDRWLETFDQARAFVAERQMASITPSASLPSVFGACAPHPDPLARGYAAWPPGKWWWPGALGELVEVQRTRLLGGRVLLVTRSLLNRVAPLLVHEVARAEDGDHGAAAQELVRFLDREGPTLLGEARRALGLSSRAMAQIREVLEPIGAVLSDDVEVSARNGGHIHTSRLSRVDQVCTASGPVEVAHRSLMVAAIRAAVCAPRREIEKWFAWPDVRVLDALIAAGDVVVAGEWLAHAEGLKVL